MKNFKNLWVAKAQTKTITSADMLTHCILRAIQAKSENKLFIAKYFVGKAFSPRSGWDYSAVKYARNAVDSNLKWGDKVLGLPSSEIFESDDEKELFKTLLEGLRGYDGGNDHG